MHRWRDTYLWPIRPPSDKSCWTRSWIWPHVTRKPSSLACAGNLHRSSPDVGGGRGERARPIQGAVDGCVAEPQRHQSRRGEGWRRGSDLGHRRRVLGGAAILSDCHLELAGWRVAMDSDGRGQPLAATAPASALDSCGRGGYAEVRAAQLYSILGDDAAGCRRSQFRVPAPGRQQRPRLANDVTDSLCTSA